MRACMPQPKYSLCRMSGATMRVTCRSSLVVTQVGMSPSVVPFTGSTEISGTGMKGAVRGLNQRAIPKGVVTVGSSGSAKAGAPATAPTSKEAARTASHGAQGSLTPRIRARPTRSRARGQGLERGQNRVRGALDIRRIVDLDPGNARDVADIEGVAMFQNEVAYGLLVRRMQFAALRVS